MKQSERYNVMTEQRYDELSYKKTFFIESKELLDAMETSLLNLEKSGNDEESINAVFRAVHTIKGNSGMFGFTIVEDFTHRLENVLQKVRLDSTNLDSDMIALLLESHDHLNTLLDFYESDGGSDLDDITKTKQDALLEQLSAYLEDESREEIQDTPRPSESCDQTISQDELRVRNECWHISLRFGKDVFRNGLDPSSFLSFLGEKGEIVRFMTVCDRLPSGYEMDPETCYLGFEIDFKGTIDKKGIEDVFDFLLDDCVLRVLPPNSRISEYVRLIQDLPETPMRIGEMLTEIGTLTRNELEEALGLQDHSFFGETRKGVKPVGSIMVQERMVQKPVLDAALEKQNIIKKKEEASRRLIRIDAEKLDHLINLIGELVIIGSSVKQISESEERIGLVKSVNDMSKLIEEIRDSTMSIRMVQIGETFNRFERVVRDLSRERGKKIELVINGGETELDKTLIDKISDPLIHLIRNSIDHGIDLPEEREKAGKPPVGRIYLNAFHETGSIVIEVSDDGNGLSRDRIYAKAVEQNLIKPEQNISDYELFQFIFAPGFSTAETITNISGRGVGMDVVKKNIESLRGSVSLNSESGRGTTVRIHLPLTLAIIDGFMVMVGESYYVLPLDMVVECTEVPRDELDSKEGGNYINLRGDVLPFMKLRDFFEEEGEEPLKPKIVVVEYARRKAGLVVDNLIGEFQTVIKPLGKIFSRLQWISGSTILGTGEVAYILDIPKLVQKMQNSDRKEAMQLQETLART